MDLGNIAKRYAKALYLYAAECKAEEKVYEQALTLCHTMTQVPELMRALINPVVEQSTKLDLLNQATGGQMEDAFMHFLRLVFRQHRESHLLFILHSYVGVYRKHKHIYVGKLITAVPMDSRMEELLRNMVSNATQDASVEFDTKVDETIQGGFILQLDDQRMDASVKGQLRYLREELMK